MGPIGSNHMEEIHLLKFAVLYHLILEELGTESRGSLLFLKQQLELLQCIHCTQFYLRFNNSILVESIFNHRNRLPSFPINLNFKLSTVNWMAVKLNFCPKK
jgi:hypothetical protein